MSAIKYDPTDDVVFFIENKYKKEKELSEIPNLEMRITQAAMHLREIKPEDFKEIPIQFKVRIFKKLHESEQKQKESDFKEQELLDFFKDDDDLAGDLFNLSLYKNTICKSFLNFSPDRGTLSFHTNKLDANGISKLLQTIPPEIKSKIKVLDISNCLNLQNLQILDGFTDLQALIAQSNFNLKTLDGIEKCLKLKILDLKECQNLQDLSKTERLGLQELDASGCRSLSDISALAGEPSRTLKKLNLSLCPSLKNYQQVISRLGALVSLKLRHLQTLFDLNFAHPLANLQELDVDFTRINNITGILGLKNLKLPKFADCPIPEAEYAKINSAKNNK